MRGLQEAWQMVLGIPASFQRTAAVLEAAPAVIQDIAPYLAELNGGIELSKTVLELNEALKDGIEQRPYTYLSVIKVEEALKRAQAALKHAETLETPDALTRQERARYVLACVEQASEMARKNRQLALENPSAAREQFTREKETPTHTPPLERAEQLLQEAEAEVEDFYPVGFLDEPSNLKSTVDAIVRSLSEHLEVYPWHKTFLEKLGTPNKEGEPFTGKVDDADGYSQVLQMRSFMNAFYHIQQGLMAIESEALREPLSSLNRAAEASTAMGWQSVVGSVRSALNFRGGSQINRVVDHLYKACDLLTHIEPDFLEAFESDFKVVDDWLNSKKVTDVKHRAQAKLSQLDLLSFSKSTVHLIGYLFDQLRPKKIGGADGFVLTEILTTLGERLDDKTSELEAVFSGSDQALSALSEFCGLEKEKLADFESVVRKEIASRPKEEKARIKKLNQIAAHLQQSLGRLNGSGLFASLDVVHYLSIAWYASSLLSEMSKKVTGLNQETQKTIRKAITDFKNEHLVAWVGFVDKVEEISLREQGSLSSPFIDWLEGSAYQTLMDSSTFVRLDKLDLKQDERFQSMRDEKLQARYEVYKTQLVEIQRSLEALRLLTCDFVAPQEFVDDKKMTSLYQLLQPHFEAVDAARSNACLLDWKERVDASSVFDVSVYPVIDGSEKENAAFIELVRKRLERMKQTKRLAIELIGKTVPDEVPYVLHVDDLVDEMPIEELALASQRKVEKYLIEATGEGSAVANMQKRLQETKEMIAPLLDKQCAYDAATGKYNDTSHDLSLAHISDALTDLKDSCGIAEYLNDTGNRFSYVASTIQLFAKWVSAISTLYPYGRSARAAYESGLEKLQTTYKAQAKHYHAPASHKASDWAYSGMHAALTGPKHCEALAKGQPELPVAGIMAAERQARDFADEVETLSQHFNIGPALLRYPTLAYDAARILFKRLVGQDTADKQAMTAARRLADAVYDNMIAHGLEGLNAHVVHEMLCAADDIERALRLLPGVLSLPLEHQIDEHMKLLLDPLSVPSEKYFKVRVNESSYYARAARTPEDSSHKKFFDRRLNQGSIYGVNLITRDDLGVVLDVENIDAELQAHVASGALALDKNKPTVLKLVSLDDGTQVNQYVVYGCVDGTHWKYTALKDTGALEKAFASQAESLDYPYSDALCEVITKAEGHVAPKLITTRKKMALEEGIDRAIDLELIRIQKSKGFELKHANTLYIAALRKMLRPAMQALVKGEGGFENRVFDLIYQTPIKDLRLFDVTAEQGSCRLDTMRRYISSLEDYLKPTYAEPHGFFFWLFENQETHQQKLKWAKQLRTLVDDKTRMPSERVLAIQALLKHTKFQEEMQACSTWFSFKGMLRGVIWLLSCVRLCAFKTRGVVSVDHLVRAADLTVSELQVFDEFYAKDYRCLDAMLKQISALEKYLDPKRDISFLGHARLYEEKMTRSNKRSWLITLRHIANNTEKTPRERIEAMRAKMLDPAFKSDLLTYSSVDDYFTFRAFKRAVLWLLSCVGLYTLPCVAEYKALMHASNPKTFFAESPLIDVEKFKESVPSTERKYTGESVLSDLGLAPAA